MTEPRDSRRKNPHEPDASPLLKRLLGPFYVTGAFWYRFHYFGVSVLPRVPVAWYVALFTFFFWVTLRRMRHAIANNLVPVLGPCGPWERERRIFRTMHSFAWCMSERYEQFWARRKLAFVLENDAIWDRLAQSPRGLIILTAHLSNWQAGSMIPTHARVIGDHAKRMHVVREIEQDGAAQEFVADLLERWTHVKYVTHFAADSAALGIELLHALRDGDIVAMQADRPRAGGQSVEVKLFDRAFDVPSGPAALARAAEVPMLPVFVIRTGRLSYRVVLREPIEVPRTRERDRDVRDAMQKVAAELEWAIRQGPEQWFCFHDLWGT